MFASLDGAHLPDDPNPVEDGVTRAAAACIMGPWPRISGPPRSCRLRLRSGPPRRAGATRGCGSASSSWRSPSSPAPGCSARPTTPCRCGRWPRTSGPVTRSAADDLVATRVRFADAGDLAGYFTVDERAARRPRADPRRRRRRAAAPGRGRHGRAPTDTLQVPVAVDAEQVPGLGGRRVGGRRLPRRPPERRRHGAGGARAAARPAARRWPRSRSSDAPALAETLRHQRQAPARAGRRGAGGTPLLPAAGLARRPGRDRRTPGLTSMVIVLVVASGAAWESPALQLLTAPPRRGGAQALRRRRRPARRGQRRAGRRGGARAGRPGPRRRRDRPPAPAPGAPGRGRCRAATPPEAGRLRAARIGIAALVAEDALDALPDAVTAVEEEPAPAADGAGGRRGRDGRARPRAPPAG